MQKLRLLFFGLLMMAWSAINAQQEKSTPNSLNPGSSTSITTAKHAKKKHHFFSPKRDSRYRKPEVTHTARYEYYVRIEKAAKEKQRILKELAKPQYSDFRYFGHKKIPKRRPPHKMRYCTECAIRH